MNIVEQYNLTLKIEVIKEQSSERLSRLCKLVEESSASNCVELLKAFSHIVNTELYMVTSIDELESLKTGMTELENKIKESLIRAFHSISDSKNFNEKSDLQDI